ncbi:MAG: GNAT family N-acetyltransferase [Sulfobacillus sp.]
MRDVTKLVDFRHSAVPLVQIKQLLSFAVGESTDEKLGRILNLYCGSRATLYVMASQNRQALGVVGFERSGDSAEILHIAVDERQRHRGIGRRMLDQLIAVEALAELIAETDRDAVEFYRRCGFATRSLGEKYPGVERFHCRFKVGL